MKDSWEERIRSAGHRVTQQRLAVLHAVRDLTHPTPEAIHSHLMAGETGGEPALSLSTVYRNLVVLQDCGLVTHAHLGSGGPIYHLSREPEHVHLSCLRCGRVQSIAAGSTGAFAAEVRALTGFQVKLSHAAVYGLCAQCSAQESSGP